MLDEGFGGGFVFLVTPLVNEVKLPTAPAEKAVTVLDKDAAALEPGNLGRVIVLDLPPDGEEGFTPRVAPPTERLVVGVRFNVGSARHHQMGINTGPGPNIRRVRLS